MKRWVYLCLGFLVALLVISSACAGVSTEGQKESSQFFKENSVLLIVPAGEGGTTDLLARLVAQHWTKVTGGQMTVKNIASGGHIVGSNTVYKSKPDGLTIGIAMGGLIQSPALNTPGCEWDATKVSYLVFMAPSEPAVVSFGLNSKYNTLQDLKSAQSIKVGTTGIDNAQAMYAAILADSYGLKDFKIVSGYKATPDAMLAAAKGEVDIMVNSGEIIREFVAKKMVKNPILNMDKVKHPIYKDLPLFASTVKLSAEQKSIYDVVVACHGKFGADKIFYGPPGLSNDTLKYLRENLYIIATSESFIADAKKLQPDRWADYLGPPTKGEDIAKDAKEAYMLLKDNQQKLTALINKYLAIK